MSISRILNSGALRYLVAGGLAFAFNVLLLNVFREVLGLPTSLSALLAFWASFFFSYSLQRMFAFRSEASVRASLFRYSVLVAFNSVVVAFVVTVCHDVLGLGLGSSQLVATAITTVWNYFAYKHWVYARRSPATGTTGPVEVNAGE